MSTTTRRGGGVSEYGLRDLTVHSDARGSLVALQGGVDVGFDIGRVFYIYGNVHNLPRAGHRSTDVHELLVCLNGSCRALVDDGENRGDFLLDRRDRALYLPSGVWVELVDFTPDCVLLVLASGAYRPAAQIRTRPVQLVVT